MNCIFRIRMANPSMDHRARDTFSSHPPNLTHLLPVYGVINQTLAMDVSLLQGGCDVRISCTRRKPYHLHQVSKHCKNTNCPDIQDIFHCCLWQCWFLINIVYGCRDMISSTWYLLHWALEYLSLRHSIINTYSILSKSRIFCKCIVVLNCALSQAVLGCTLARDRIWGNPFLYKKV